MASDHLVSSTKATQYEVCIIVFSEKSPVLSPMVKLSSSTPQLGATPATTSTQVVDMQGNISQTPTVAELDDPAYRLLIH